MRRGLVISLLFIVGLAVAALGATIGLGHKPLLGLDLKGGLSVVLQPQHKVSTSILDVAVSIIDRRVNGLGVSGASVARQGDDVVIEIPGVKNPQQALNELGQTATLYFRPVICEIPPYSAPAPTTTTTKPATSSKKALGGASTGASATANLAAAFSTAGSTGAYVPPTSAEAKSVCSSASSASTPTTPVADDNSTDYVVLPYYLDPSSSPRYVLGPADMSGSGISTALTIVDQTTGQYQVQVNFTSKGATEFDKIASERYPYYDSSAGACSSSAPFACLEAFELDGTVYSAPQIQASSFNGSAVISGASTNPFSLKQANDLAFALKYGSLPVRFTAQSIETVSATIGQDSLHAGLFAGIGGLLIVMLYMIIYYRALGVVVLVGLGVGGALLYSIISELSVTSNLTLTLEGITGIIVSIGITADSYVIYFERLKDEVRSGRTVRQSVERSFSRAFRTVLTADLVALMAAVILYLLTVGDVKGFAFMLGLSTVLDIVAAFLFIRPAVILIGRRRSIVEAPVFGIGRGLALRPAGGDG